MNGGDDDCYNDAGGGCDVDDAGGDDVDGYDTDDDEYDDDDGGGDDDDDNDNAADDDDDGESHSLHLLSWTSKAHAVSLEVHCHLEMHPMHRALPQACPSPQA